MLSLEDDRPVCDAEEELYYIRCLSCVKGHNKPYVTELTVNGISTTFEIDTGAGVTIISADTYFRLFSDIKLEEATIGIKTYSNEPGIHFC